MERERKWGIKRDVNGNIVISLQKQLDQQYQKLDEEPFNQLPSIQKWITFLKSGAVPASRINHLVNVIHGISNQLKVMPETLISYGVPIDATKRKELAIEYWQNFLAWFNTAYTQMQKTNTINAYRSFLAAHSINFAHGEGKRYGLSTTSERSGEYKDIMLTPEQIDRINKSLQKESDWETWSFMNIDMHTGAGAFAMASMSRDRIAFSPLFRVEQFESKTKRGDWYLISCLKKGNFCSLNDAESNYNSQIDVQFTVVEQACDTTNSDLTSSDSDTLLNQLEDRWVGDSTSRDFAFLFTGKDISRSGSSANIGLANLHGIHTPTTAGYGLAQMVSQTGYSASSYQKEILTSHEIGHIFNAIHGEAISWCATWVFGNCVEWNYSVMYDPFQGDDMTDLFSDGTNGADFDNEERIRTEADDHL